MKRKLQVESFQRFRVGMGWTCHLKHPTLWQALCGAHGKGLHSGMLPKHHTVDCERCKKKLRKLFDEAFESELRGSAEE